MQRRRKRATRQRRREEEARERDQTHIVVYFQHQHSSIMAKANPTAAANSTPREADDPTADNQLYLKWTERLSAERRKDP